MEGLIGEVLFQLTLNTSHTTVMITYIVYAHNVVTALLLCSRIFIPSCSM
jgi:hypothetical protein